MLPSVGASSAALTTYAQAAVAASGHSARDPEQPVRTDQEAARKQGEGTAAPPADDTLAHDARQAVDALLRTLYQRVESALSDAGLPQALAEEAARKAVERVAAAIVRQGEHAARIVQAVLDRLESGQAADEGVLLHVAARGLTVLVDHGAGTVEVTDPAFDIAAATRPDAGSATPAVHHLLDVTDANAAPATPVLAALGVIHDAAEQAASASIEAAPAATATPDAALFVAPDALAAAIGEKLHAYVPADAGFGPETAAVVARIVAAAINAADGASRGAALGRAVAAVAALAPEQAESARQDGRVVLASDDLRVVLQPQAGSVTVRIGSRVVAFAPASLSPAAVHSRELPEVSAASLPIRDISPGLPQGVVLDEPAGVPFVPPDVSELPPKERKRAPDAQPPSPPVSAAQQNALHLLETAAGGNLIVLRGIGVHAAGAAAHAVTRISLDVSTAVGPSPTAAAPPESAGRLGRSAPAPAQTEDGPVDDDGYTDGTATAPPVLPPSQAVGLMPFTDLRPAGKKAAPRLRRPRRDETREDALTRDTPPGYEGVVYSSVGFEV